MSTMERIVQQLAQAEMNERVRDKTAAGMLADVQNAAEMVIDGSLPIEVFVRMVEWRHELATSDSVSRVLTSVLGQLAGPHAIQDEGP